MSWLSKLRERFIKKGRVILDDRLPRYITQANVGDLYSFLQSIKAINQNRKSLVETIDKMAFDSIIGSAMELITDDVCQEDPVTDKCVWVVGEDQETTDFIMDFLEEINIEKNLPFMVYNIVRYGEIYYKTYFSEFRNGEMPTEFESLRGYIYKPLVNDFSLAEIHKYGQPLGFAKINEDGSFNLFTTDDYIHIYNNRMNHFDTVNLETVDEYDNKKTEDFDLIYGTPLFESALQAWRMVDLIESLLIFIRFGQSGFFRLVKVDLAGATSTEAEDIMANLYQVFNQQDNFNVQERVYSGSRKPIPHGENLIIPVKQGKGDVSVEQVGGDSDIKEVVDLDYWRNKLFAALKMPKAYLGFEETMPGSLGNTTLTQQDIRYARSVKSVKKTVKEGMYQIIDHYLKAVGREYWVGKYEVFMTQIMSAETIAMEENLNAKIGLAESLKNLFDGNEIIDQAELSRLLLDEILDLGDKCDILIKEDKTAATEEGGATSDAAAMDDLGLDDMESDLGSMDRDLGGGMPSDSGGGMPEIPDLGGFEI